MGTAKIIVTGGAGFIGSNLVEGLNRRGLSDILVVDNLGRDEKWRNLSGLQFADYLQKDAFVGSCAGIGWEKRTPSFIWGHAVRRRRPTPGI